MGRPPRASSASTRIVGFRLTEEEERRLDELVKEQGHKDRSALLRAWLVQAGPGPRKAEPLEQDGSSEENDPPSPDVFEQVYEALRREHDPRLGLIHVPNVVRALMPSVPASQVHAVLLALHERGTLELRPEAGGEFLREEDAALCPRGPRETVFSFARWTR